VEVVDVLQATERAPDGVRNSRRLMRCAVRLLAGLLLAGAAVLLFAIVHEARSSRLQARALSQLAGELHVDVQPGPAATIRFPGPDAGPYDQRLGYARLPAFIDRLTTRDFAVTAQARPSAQLLALQDHGLFAIYRERSQAGLLLQDCRGDPLYAERLPRRVHERFDAVPPLLVDALLFIENRELLDPGSPLRNPAVEWDRLAQALLGRMMRIIDPGHPAPGGSTLATQIEKYRHSPEGRTRSMHDKLQQMASASVRAYLDGENTEARRRQIVVDYLDTVPLSAQAGVGEVNGLGDAMWAWYGRDFDEVQRLLRPLGRPADGALDRAPEHARGNAADHPQGHSAGQSPDRLPAPPPGVPRDLRDGTPAGLIPAWLPAPTPAARAAQALLTPQQPSLPEQALAFKQALSLLVAQRRPSYYLGEGAARLEALTNSHLRVMAEAGVITPWLRDAALPLPLALLPHAPAEEAAALEQRKLTATARSRLSALLDVPLSYDLDRLDLSVAGSIDGSAQREVTRRLRALRDPATAQAAGLVGHQMLGPGDDPGRLVFSISLYERGERANLLRVQADSGDQPFDINEGARLDLGSTAKLRTLVTYLELVADLHHRWTGLDAQALKALPLHPHDHLGRWARDHLAHATDRSLAAMTEAAMDRRYSASPGEAFRTGGGLHRFVNFDREHDHRVMSVREALRHSVNLVFIRLMRDIVQRHLHAGPDGGAATPDSADPGERRRLLAKFADREGRVYLTRFYRQYRPRGDAAPKPLPAADDADLARRHPLEQWLVGYLHEHPGATLSQVLAASAAQRQEAYAWLFRTRRAGAQDVRIRGLQEVAAFQKIHRSWQRLGYPFDALTPSYATAIGASGDRPASLAELMGILANDGLRLPATRTLGLHFAAGTPYETQLQHRPTTPPQRVLPLEVARTLKRALVDVVEAGTARRLAGAFVTADGRVLSMGGKTGTGDHRFEVYGPGGRLISSRVVNRTATFAFVLGERHYGTVMIHAQEPDAARFRFTSALATQVLKSLAPVLVPAMDRTGCPPPLAAPKAVGW
jgi:membrane peptidoglycan carboxypeptidase